MQKFRQKVHTVLFNLRNRKCKLISNIRKQIEEKPDRGIREGQKDRGKFGEDMSRYVHYLDCIDIIKGVKTGQIIPFSYVQFILPVIHH